MIFLVQRRLYAYVDCMLPMASTARADNAKNETSGAPQGADSSAYLASCLERGILRPVDDPRTGAPRLHIEPRHALSDASCDGASGLLEVQERAEWSHVSATLPSDG